MSFNKVDIKHRKPKMPSSHVRVPFSLPSLPLARSAASNFPSKSATATETKLPHFSPHPPAHPPKEASERQADPLQSFRLE